MLQDLFRLPPDIFDLEFMEDWPDREFYSQFPYIDLANTGANSHSLPFYQILRDDVLTRGRPSADDQLEIAQRLKEALCVRALMTFYLLVGMGHSKVQAEDHLRGALSGCTLSFATIMKIGKVVCTHHVNVSSWTDLKTRSMAAGSQGLKTKPLATRDSETRNVLVLIRPLAKAYNRARRLDKNLYDINKYTRPKMREKKLKSAIDYNNNDKIRPTNAVDGLVVSLYTYTNPSEIWHDYRYYRYIFDCAIPIGRMLSGYKAGFTVIQLYVLYRLLEDKQPISPYLENGKYHSIVDCQTILRKLLGEILSVEMFLAEVEKILKNYELLQARPATVRELEDRCQSIAGEYYFESLFGWTDPLPASVGESEPRQRSHRMF